MAISKGFRYKDKEGKVTDYEYGVNGSNVTQDSEHRLVTDEEKQTWNDKADLEDIPSGSAASHAVANNCTTTQAGSVLDARQGKVLMDKANQLSSEFADRLQGDVRIIPEGSGADTKYYAQVGADAASKKPLGRPIINFRAYAWSGEGGGWGIARLTVPEGYSTLEITEFSGSGNVYGYTSDSIGDAYGDNLGLLSETTFDIRNYVQFGVRVNQKSAAKCMLY